ncbi:MAG TPA: S8 family serine peptidase [Thioalkalivibrio sp.]|nr:S8 family serine peptidase [Thioalkalivibrio sp.]
MISVSATTSSDAMASWSSFGDYVNLSAPGASILTTNTSGGYTTASGTSFASPVAAGVVAW